MLLKLLCGSLLLSQSLMATELSFKNYSIADDDIVASIKQPKPPSVTDLINVIKSKVAIGDKITKLDISENYICVKGATALFKYISSNLPDLQYINLANNRVQYFPNDIEYRLLETELKKILIKPAFRSIDLSLNYLDHTWHEYIYSTFKSPLARKIILEYSNNEN